MNKPINPELIYLNFGHQLFFQFHLTWKLIHYIFPMIYLISQLVQ